MAVERGEARLMEFDLDVRFEADDAVHLCGSAEATPRLRQMRPQVYGQVLILH